MRAKFGFCFLTVTPPWLTSAGRLGAAWLTRFWTSTAAMSSGYPTSKVTVMVAEPSLELVEDR